MSVTPEEVRTRAARKLGLYGIGQTLPAEISSDLDRAYTEVFKELEAQQMNGWTESQDVPDQYVGSMVALVAAARVSDYKTPVERMSVIVTEAEMARRKIWAMRDKAIMGQTRIEYF